MTPFSFPSRPSLTHNSAAVTHPGLHVHPSAHSHTTQIECISRPCLLSLPPGPTQRPPAHTHTLFPPPHELSAATCICPCPLLSPAAPPLTFWWPPSCSPLPISNHYQCHTKLLHQADPACVPCSPVLPPPIHTQPDRAHQDCGGCRPPRSSHRS